MTVILLDVDFFKPYNDNYGHIQGDKCLQGLANTLKVLFVRAGEYVGRYGGEEFVLILSDTDSDAAEQQAIRIKEALYDMNYAHEYSNISDRVTASQGVLSFVPSGDESLASIYEKVDQALYQAKQSGRNTYIQRNILEHSR
jgi:diguanylate cyclase (GGDEF)-like protein